MIFFVSQVENITIKSQDPTKNVHENSIVNQVENQTKDPSNKNDETEEKEVSAGELSFMRKLFRKGIIESKNDVEILQKDPNSPLYAVKTFEALNLRPQLLEGIYDMGFKLPSKIQETALPCLLVNP